MIDDTYRNIPIDKLEAFQQLSEEMAEDRLYFMGEAAGEIKGEAKGKEKGILSERVKNLQYLTEKMSIQEAADLLKISLEEANQLLEENI